jgi:hypothetical protein
MTKRSRLEVKKTLVWISNGKNKMAAIFILKIYEMPNLALTDFLGSTYFYLSYNSQDVPI